MKYFAFLMVMALIQTECIVAKTSKPIAPEPPAPPANSQFELEKGLLDTLYKGSVEESSTEFRSGASALTFTPVLSFITPNQLSLSNNYWEVPYTSQLGSIPAFSLNVSNPLAYWGDFSLLLKGNVGYSYKEAAFSATSKQTGKESRGVLTLHWLPLSMGTRIEYRLFKSQIVKPFVEVGGGIQWLYQSGKLDGIEQGFWIPFYQTSLGLTFFGTDDVHGNWFGGINIGGSLRNSFASQQNIRAGSLDVGININL